MKKVIIHAGAPKTGTTAIQKFLHNNQEALALNDLILYPTSGRKNGRGNTLISHMPLAKAFTFNNDVHSVLKDVLAETHGLNKIIFSSERFFGQLHQPGVAKSLVAIKEFFHGNDIKILIYLRRWDSYLESCYSQAVANGVLGMKASGESIHDFIVNCEKLIGWHPADYIKYLQTLENIFGKNAIEIRGFDSKAFKGGDVITDFCEAIEIKKIESYLLPERSNLTLNAKKLLVMSMLLPLTNSKELLAKKVKKLFNAETGQFSPYCLFNYEERVSLINRFRKDEEKLRAYMKDPSGFLFDLDSIEDKSKLPPIQFTLDELAEFRDLILDMKTRPKP